MNGELWLFGAERTNANAFFPRSPTCETTLCDYLSAPFFARARKNAAGVIITPPCVRKGRARKEGHKAFDIILSVQRHWAPK